jgi:hypothetical protein
VKLAGSGLADCSTTSVFGLPGVQSVFFIYGIVFAALVCSARRDGGSAGRLQPGQANAGRCCGCAP